MDRKNLASCLIILMMFCCSNADFAQDKKVCQQQLLNLSPCLNFVTGDAKAPSPSCCTELQRDAVKSKFCLCVLIRDRNEPSLGFKLNATRALSLNPLCKTNSNATICPGIYSTYQLGSSVLVKIYSLFLSCWDEQNSFTYPRTRLRLRCSSNLAIVQVLEVAYCPFFTIILLQFLCFTLSHLPVSMIADTSHSSTTKLSVKLIREAAISAFLVWTSTGSF